jgi:hypothetical protein
MAGKYVGYLIIAAAALLVTFFGLYSLGIDQNNYHDLLV